MNRDTRILVTGANGLVGSAIMRKLRSDGYRCMAPSSSTLNLLDRAAVFNYFRDHKPQFVFNAAVRSGGLFANSALPAEFLSDNLQMQVNLLDAAHTHDSERFLYIASSRIYPRDAQQPVSEGSLLTGQLQDGLEPYAIGKIAGVLHVSAYRRQYGRKYISIAPCNLYGPNDNFDDTQGHVIAMLMRRMHDAKLSNAFEFKVFGSGKPFREFLHADDMAAACVLAMHSYDEDIPINAGSGSEISIGDLAGLMAKVVGYEGHLMFDTSKPDGTMRFLLNSHRLRKIGWRPTIDLEDGLRDLYRWFLHHRT